MDEREFIAKRQPQWERLTAILDKASGASGLKALTREELRALGPLYRRAASDLAYARAQEASDSIVLSLNGLVARAYAMFYQTDRRQWGGLACFFTHDFPDTFRRRLPFFLASLFFLALG